MKHFLAVMTLLASTSGAWAADWVLALGSSNFNDNTADNSAITSTELHSNPFFNRNRFSTSYMGVITAHSSGDVFVGVGLSALLGFNTHWFIEGSIAPGYFNESSPGNDLGSAFEFRSIIGVGYALESGDRISIAVTHKSNAGTANRNPGVDSVLLRYRHSF